MDMDVATTALHTNESLGEARGALEHAMEMEDATAALLKNESQSDDNYVHEGEKL